MPTGDASRSLTASEQEWLRVRVHLREHRHRLAVAAAELYPDAVKVADSPLLTTSAWLPDEPISLQSIELTWTPEADRPGLFPPDELTAQVRPMKSDGTRHPSYSAAMAELAAPSVFENRTTYRLRSADLRGAPRMVFEPGRYFDNLDVGEACAHEFAANELGLLDGTPLRDAIGDPCDPGRRPMSIAVATLTLRHERRTGEASFPLHWRDPAKVGQAGGTCMVIPVGIFQARDEDQGRQLADLSLWDCLVREYGEEMLGLPEEVEQSARTEDFARSMREALQDRHLTVSALALGVDPLTLGADLLTVAVIDADCYDDLFGALVSANAEGCLVQDPRARAGQFRFASDDIGLLVGEGRLQAAGAALLQVALGRSSELLLGVNAPI